MNVTIDGIEYVPALKLREPGGTLGAVLRDCRKALHLTLDQASAKAGCAKSYLWELEKDRAMPGLDMATRIARVYGVPVGLLGACTLQPNNR